MTTPMGEQPSTHMPVTYDRRLGRAELATALTGSGGAGHIYVVEHRGPFEDDPNLTNKRFPGNPTRPTGVSMAEPKTHSHAIGVTSRA